MARIRVFAHSAKPATDRPIFCCTKSNALRLIRTAAAVLIAQHAIQLLPLLKATRLSAKDRQSVGYDHAAGLGKVSDFRQAWEMRDSAGFEMWQMNSRDRIRSTP